MEEHVWINASSSAWPLHRTGSVSELLVTVHDTNAQPNQIQSAWVVSLLQSTKSEVQGQSALHPKHQDQFSMIQKSEALYNWIKYSISIQLEHFSEKLFRVAGKVASLAKFRPHWRWSVEGLLYSKLPVSSSLIIYRVHVIGNFLLIFSITNAERAQNSRYRSPPITDKDNSYTSLKKY